MLCDHTYEDTVKLCDTSQAMLFKEKLGVIIYYTAETKITSWHLIGFPSRSNIIWSTFRVYYLITKNRTGCTNLKKVLVCTHTSRIKSTNVSGI